MDIGPAWNGSTDRDAAYNGQLATGASTTFGYVVNGGPPPTALPTTCQAT
jgi:hypothetical protein